MFARVATALVHGLGALAGLLFGQQARAVDLPGDKAEAMLHAYDGGGVRANGPAFLVRKSIADRVSLNGSYYVDMVSNASIDVVTTASPFKETRNAYEVGADYAVRDTLVSLKLSRSDEPDYKSDSLGADISQEVFGGMTTVSLGFSRGSDDVYKKNEPGFHDTVTRWQYRLGATQILTPRLLASANFEAVSEDGFLGSPYRVARVFGAAVPERNPRARTSRALQLRAVWDMGSRDALAGGYRYFWDTWDVRAHSFEVEYRRHVAPGWLASAHLRYHAQDAALFYSDNATVETTYISRNRQLSKFNDVAIGAKATYTFASAPGRYELQAHANYEYLRFDFDNFTDLRSGKAYAFNAHVLQLLVTASF